ncbi:MAG: holo-ACP synthase [Pseudomonadota bacterium]
MGKVLGVGIDLEPVASFRRKKPSTDRRFFERLFSEREIAYCLKFRDPAPRFAARFCAKEAIVKAVGSRFPLNVFDCEIRNDRNGAPNVFPRSKKAKLRAFFARHKIQLSISHTDDTAVAVAILVTKKS